MCHHYTWQNRRGDLETEQEEKAEDDADSILAEESNTDVELLTDGGDEE